MIELIRVPRVMLIVAGLVLVGAVFTAGLVMAQRAERIEDEARELAGTEGVVHILAEQSIDGSGISATFEAWIDAGNDRAKHVAYDTSGNPVIEVVVDGTERTVHKFSDDVATKHVGTGPDDPILRSIMVDLWHIGARHRQGQASVLEETEVDGIPAIKVRVPIQGLASSVVASLHLETLLPLEEEYFDGEGNVVASRSTRYSLVETLDTVAPGLFASSSRSDRVYEVRTRMTLSQAQDFDGFDIYYVGEAVGDLSVFWIQHDERSSIYHDQGHLNVVLIHYTPNGTAPSHGTKSTTLVRTERATSEDISVWEQKGREIHEGVVRQLDGDDFRLELLRGEVLVTLRASSESELETMRGQLVKLN